MSIVQVLLVWNILIILKIVTVVILIIKLFIITQHKKCCKHFEIAKPDVSNNVNINDATLKLNFYNEKTESECDSNIIYRC